MSEPETRGTRSEARIDVHDDAACRYWCAHLGIRPKELKRIVHIVGDRVTDVEDYLAEAKLHDYFEEDNTEASPT